MSHKDADMFWGYHQLAWAEAYQAQLRRGAAEARLAQQVCAARPASLHLRLAALLRRFNAGMRLTGKTAEITGLPVSDRPAPLKGEREKTMKQYGGIT